VDVPGGKFAYPLTNKISYHNNAPAIPAQETWVAKIPTSEGMTFLWMGDRWGSCPDRIKGHDFQYWTVLEFGTNGDILPIQNIGR
jgi:hypothetical protein